MNLVDLELVIYNLCEDNDIEDAEELEELHLKIADAVGNALLDYADDRDIEDFDIYRYYRR